MRDPDVDEGSVVSSYYLFILHCRASTGHGRSTLEECFFFDQCCARHNNCGSHEIALNWSSVDNTIAQIGQRTKQKQNQSKPTAPTTKEQTDQNWPIYESETGETCVRSHYLVHSSIPRLSQPLQQHVECNTSNNSIPSGPQLQWVQKSPKQVRYLENTANQRRVNSLDCQSRAHHICQISRMHEQNLSRHTFNSWGMQKQKRVKLELLAEVFPPAKKVEQNYATQKNKTNEYKETNKKELVKNSQKSWTLSAPENLSYHLFYPAVCPPCSWSDVCHVHFFMSVHSKGARTACSPHWASLSRTLSLMLDWRISRQAGFSKWWTLPSFWWTGN